MAESINESAKKMASNEQVNQALENGSDFFKKWLDFQMDFAKNTTANEAVSAKSVQDNMENWKKFYENLFQNQAENLQKMYTQNQEMWKNWTGSMAQNNPFAGNMNAFGNWSTQMNEMYAQMMNNFNGQGNTKSVFEGMYNNMQSFSKFYELMNPLFKAMQNNQFNYEQFTNYFKPEAFKGFMDSFFGFMPEQMQGMMKENMNKWTEGMQNWNKEGMNMFGNMQMQFPWQQFIPGGNQFFAEMLNNYNNMYSQMQNAVAPFAKLMTPNSFSATAEETSAILDMMNRYQISNAQMQYMTYTTGLKAMDAMGKHIAEMTKEGKTFGSMQEMFKTWLNTSDKFFVELFESDEFSKTQAENSALSLRMKHAIDGQMEKMFSHFPLVPRSEMEELYKTVYELKKRIRTMEKSMENTSEVVEKPAAATKKSAK
ncbi:MAG: hypothetical protein JNL57_04505 [Bacteroidetes bacterium]|nr:hypothetical protein [Bacteroidota bacterium]